MMKNIYFLLILFISGISTRVNGQATVISDQVLASDVELSGVAVSPNGQYRAVAFRRLSVTPEIGFVKLINASNDSILQSFTINPNQEFTNTSLAVNDNGEIILTYVHNVRSDNKTEEKTVKLNSDGSIELLYEMAGMGTSQFLFIGDIAFIIIGYGQYGYDPMNSGFPTSGMQEGDRLFVAYNVQTKTIVWTHYLGNLWNDQNVEIAKILPMPNGNLAVKRYADGVLSEYNSQTGDYVREILNPGVTASWFVWYQYNENGELEYTKYTSQGDRWMIQLDTLGNEKYRTDYPASYYNMFQSGGSQWVKRGDHYLLNYGVSMGLNLVHGRKVSLGIEYGRTVRASWANTDGTITTLEEVDNQDIFHLIRRQLPNDNIRVSLNPNAGGNVTDMRFDEVWNGSAWVPGFHEHTIVFSNGNLPAVGSTPNTAWYQIPNGYYVGTYNITNVEELTRNGKTERVFRLVMTDNNDPNHLIAEKFYLREASEVTAVTENPLKNVKVYPNPATDFIKIASDNEIILTAEIFTLQGQKLLENHRCLSLDVSQLPAGMYLVRITNDQGDTGVFKISIK